MSNFITHINFWVVLGFIGQFLFGSRFFIQWIVSEKRGESVIPEVFWYLSMAGSVILFSCAIYRRDPVFIMGQCSGLIRARRPPRRFTMAVRIRRGHAGPARRVPKTAAE